MARPARPWFRASHHMWYTTLDGQQTPLDVTDPNDEAAAWAAFQALLQRAKTLPCPAPPPTQTVAEVVAAYLADAETRVKGNTMKGYRWYLSRFVARFGTLLVSALLAKQIEADSRRSTWSNTTRNNYLSTIETCLAWAGIKLKLRKPGKESAGADLVILDPIYRRMLQHCKGDWHACLVFLWNTGARPSEASAMTVEVVDWDNRLVRLKEHKTARHGKGERLVYLNDEAMEVLTWQRERYGSGLLFRSLKGGRLSQQAFVMKFCRLSKIVGRRVTSYGMRHSYATRALARGESDSIVAALLGHHGTQMIHKHYSHTSQMGRELKAAADRIGKAG